MKRARHLLQWTLLAMVFAYTGQLHAQAAAGSQSTTLLFTRYTLKPDHVSQWLQLEKDQVLPALKKAGVTHLTVFETVLGDAPEYTTVRTLEGFQEFDGPDPLVRALGAAAAAQLHEKLAVCTQSIHRSLEKRREDFFLDPGNAQVQYASKYRAMPGKSQAYMDFFRTEMDRQKAVAGAELLSGRRRASAKVYCVGLTRASAPILTTSASVRHCSFSIMRAL